MNYQLVCSDIDGTLLNKTRELSTATLAAVRRIAPIPFVLISSRMPRAMRHLQDALGCAETPLIAYNGGLVMDGETVLHSTVIASDISEAVVRQCEGTNIHISLYHADEWYVPAMDYWARREANNTRVQPLVRAYDAVLSTWKKEGKGAHKLMCMGEAAEIDALSQFLETTFGEALMCYRSKPTYLEISHRSISKKTGLEQLLKKRYPHLSMAQVVAFGDHHNDLALLAAVGLGMAVANAQQTVLDIADKITDSNLDDGVAKALDKLFPLCK